MGDSVIHADERKGVLHFGEKSRSSPSGWECDGCRTAMSRWVGGCMLDRAGSITGLFEWDCRRIGGSDHTPPISWEGEMSSSLGVGQHPTCLGEGHIVLQHSHVGRKSHNCAWAPHDGRTVVVIARTGKDVIVDIYKVSTVLEPESVIPQSVVMDLVMNNASSIIDNVFPINSPLFIPCLSFPSSLLCRWSKSKSLYFDLINSHGS